MFMKNKMKYIPILLATPLLFMGADYGDHVGGAYPNYYEDYQVTAIDFEAADENGKYPFTITIENTGDSYIAVTRNFGLEYHNDYFTFIDESVIGDVDNGLCLAPHSTGTYKSFTPASETFSLDDSSHYCYAYAIYQNIEVEYTNIKYIGKEATEGGAYYTYEAQDYSYHDEEGNEYYYYSKMVDVTIKGEKYAFFDDFASKDIRFGLTDDTLMESDIIVNEIRLIQGSETGKRFSDALMKGALWCVVAIAGAIFLILTLGVFPIFILPVIIRKSRQKNK